MGLIVIEFQQLDDVWVLDFPQDIDFIVDEIRFSTQNASLFTGSKKKILNFGRFEILDFSKNRRPKFINYKRY